MVITVESVKCCLRVCWIKLSVAVSTDAVASSRTKTLFFLSRTLPRHTNCLWPILQFSPFSLTATSTSTLAISSRLDLVHTYVQQSSKRNLWNKAFLLYFYFVSKLTLIQSLFRNNVNEWAQYKLWRTITVIIFLCQPTSQIWSSVYSSRGPNYFLLSLQTLLDPEE